MIHCDSTIEPLHGELADLPSTSLELSEPEAPISCGAAWLARSIDIEPKKQPQLDFKISTLLAERHHFRLPVAERIKRFVWFAAGASASKALTASATRKQAFVEFWW